MVQSVGFGNHGPIGSARGRAQAHSLGPPVSLPREQSRSGSREAARTQGKRFSSPIPASGRAGPGTLLTFPTSPAYRATPEARTRNQRGNTGKAWIGDLAVSRPLIWFHQVQRHRMWKGVRPDVRSLRPGV